METRSDVRLNPRDVGSVGNDPPASPRHDSHLDQLEDEAARTKRTDEKDVRKRVMGCTTSRDTAEHGNAAYKTKASAEGKDRAGHAGLQRSSSNMHIGNTDTLSVEASSSGYSANKPFEDAHVIVGSAGSAHMPPHVFSAVLDGHGGHHTAEFVKGRVYETFVQRMAKNGNDVKEAFVWTFQTIDAQFLSQAAKDQHMLTCGACVCAVYIDLNSAKLWVANLGDVRCVLGSCGETSMREGDYVRECKLEHQVGRAITKDHNAKYESERKKHLRGVKEEHRKDVFRVRDGVWRVKGVLQVTRAVGDGICKEKRLAMTFNRTASPDYRILPLPGDGGRPPYVSNVAEVHMVELTPNDTHIIIASDGLWDEVGNTEAAMRCMCYDSFRSQPLGKRPSMAPSPIQHVPSFVSLTKQPGNMSADLVFYALWKVVKRVDPVSATLQNLVSVPQLDTMHMLDAYSILLSRKAFHDDITAVVLKLNWPEEDPSPQIVLPRGIKPASELRINSPSGKRHWEALRFLGAFHMAYRRFLRRQWHEWIALATEKKACEPVDGLLSSAPAQ